jgi:hypothetical protein
LDVIREVEENHDSLGCDIEYLVLASICKKEQIQFQDLYSIFNNATNISENDLKSVLDNLYKNRNHTANLLGRFGHIVFLHNQGERDIIEEAGQINNQTFISAMPRAEAILEVSFRFTFSNFLYYQTYIDKNTTNYFKYYMSDIIKYFNYQYELLARLYTVHLIELKKIYNRYNNSENWLTHYKDHFAYENNLQLENMIRHIDKFIDQLLTSIELTDDNKSKLRKYKKMLNQVAS